MDGNRSIRPRKVLVAFQVINTASIETLAGIIRYIRTSAHWNIQILTFPNVLSTDVLLRARDVDGIILHQPVDDKLGKAILSSATPLVVIGNSCRMIAARKNAISFVDADNLEIGRMAARHFLQIGGFRSFGFLPDIPHTRWSKLRLDGFAAELRRHRVPASVFHSKHPENSSGYGDDLQCWIGGLTAPAAVLLAGDYRATAFFNACSTVGMSIPGDIAVLGVDNNAIICDALAPSLSSIDPSFENEGYEAAATLEQIMSRAPRVVLAMRVPPAGIVERESTHSKTSGTALVDRAARFIEAKADHPITARDVAIQLGVSQQLLALRFRQLLHRSVRETIISTRLGKAEQLLRQTSLGLSSIAQQCGFKSANYLTHVFKRHFGKSPSSLRRTNVKTSL